MPRLRRALDVVMAAVFAFATVVQLNDPDPGKWAAIYGGACVVSVVAAMGRRVPRAVVAMIGVVALVWGLSIVLGGPDASAYGRMFDAWEMASVGIEEAREASGLFIVAGWMTVLWCRRVPQS